MRNIGCLVLVLLAVAALVAYDQYRIEQMRSEVRAITGRLHEKASPGAKDSDRPDMVTSLAEAERHTKRAKSLIRQNKDEEAEAALDEALRSLKSARGVSKDMVGDAAQLLGDARDTAVSTFQKAWSDISEEARPKRRTTQ